MTSSFRKHIPNEIVNNFYHLPKALLAVALNQYPASDMTVIGVTGTDGKTSTTNLIYHILKSAGFKVSMISTIKAVIGDKEYDTGLHVTNPDPFMLQKLLNEAKENGSKYAVLEVTSHGLAQYRNIGANISIGVITNISHEHLDYHKTMHNYIATKAKILKGVKYSVLNRDDKNFMTLKNHSCGRLFTFGVKKQADFTPKTFSFKTRLPGLYNKYNCLAAIAVARILGVEDEQIRKAVLSFKGIPGRMEEVKNKKGFRVFIDFAHKPNALENILLTSRKMTKGRVIAVFGAAGLRDRTKRPIMGEIAGRLADISVLTAEDPRTENVNRIINQISRGVQKTNGKLYKIPDRRKAINYAIKKLAKKGDLLLFLGKGHEKSMCFGKTEYPWDEKEEIIKALGVKNVKSGKILQ